MGIKNLNKLINETAGVIRKIPLENLRNTKIAVDTPIYIGKSLYSYLPHYFDSLTDEEVENYTYIPQEDLEEIYESIINRFMSIFELYSSNTNAKFIMIIEGKDIPELKHNYEMSRRSDLKQKSYERFRKHIQDGDIEKARRSLPSFQDLDITSMGHMLLDRLDEAGYEYIIADGEAEKYACKMVKDGVADFVLSTDTDCLAMQQSFIKDIDTIKHEYIYVDYDKLLNKLGMTPCQFTDLCIMCGCDYNDNIPRIGVMKSLKLINQYGSIENLPNNLNVNHLNYMACRSIFNIDE